MSEIDEYKHKIIGWTTCPSDYPIVYGNLDVREIPLYRLEETAPDWDAKIGDVLLGGGMGEAAALRISLPEAILFSTSDWDEYKEVDEVFHAYWSMSDAFVFGNGYTKLGWELKRPIEFWLAEQIVAFLLKEFPAAYKQFQGDEPISVKQSIFRIGR